MAERNGSITWKIVASALAALALLLISLGGSKMLSDLTEIKVAQAHHATKIEGKLDAQTKEVNFLCQKIVRHEVLLSLPYDARVKALDRPSKIGEGP